MPVLMRRPFAWGEDKELRRIRFRLFPESSSTASASSIDSGRGRFLGLFRFETSFPVALDTTYIHPMMLFDAQFDMSKSPEMPACKKPFEKVKKWDPRTTGFAGYSIHGM